MIDLSQGLILSLILKAFFTGMAIGVLYEGVRIAKMLLGIGGRGRVGKILSAVFLFFTDLLVCLIFASCAMLLTYNISGGVFRCSVYFAMAVGLLLYRQTIGRLTMGIERVLAGFIRKLIYAVLKLVLIPMRLIFSLLYRLYALTIGRIIVKIRCRVAQRRKEKSVPGDIDPTATLNAATSQESNDEENGANGAGRYKKGERISFGRGRDRSGA